MLTEINQILLETEYENNPYFTNLRDETFSKEDFIETQIQFYNVVTFFSRPISALAAKIPTAELRLEILRNAWEEHGEGDLYSSHGYTFAEFLYRLANISESDIKNRVLWPETRIFNTALIGTCVLDEYLVGTALIGIIERMFCQISSWIGQSIIQSGWIAENKIIHYNIHKELDIKHSEDFFRVLELSWNKTLENRYQIKQGLRMGATLFNNFYESLYKNRQRRIFVNPEKIFAND